MCVRESAPAIDEPAGVGCNVPADYARAFARLEILYFINAGFLDHDGWILSNIAALRDTPGTIVQGRYDMICPPATAHALSEAWPGARLHMIPVAGHALSEPGISAELVRVMDRMGM